mgnify:CR=1 FL=1
MAAKWRKGANEVFNMRPFYQPGGTTAVPGMDINVLGVGARPPSVRPLVGRGGGGGRPDFASAGGKDASRIDDAISAATATVDTVLGS